MSPEHIKELAPFLKVFRFGSPELENLHRENMRADGMYGNFHDIHYVVFHEGVNGSPSFKTLNVIRYGQRVPEIHDFPPEQ